MQANGKNPTILVVDDDEVLGQVLARVLTRDDRTVVRATSAAQALQLADEQPPQVALVDLCLPDVDGVELAKGLRSRHADVPLILMTAYPLRLRDHPEMASHFTRVMAKPLNLQELRQAVDFALDKGSAQIPEPALAPIPETPLPPPRVSPSTQVNPAPAAAQPPPVTHRSKVRLIVAGIAVAAIALVGLAWLAPGIPLPWKNNTDSAQPPSPTRSIAVELDKTDRHTLLVPLETEKTLGIKDANGNYKGVVPAVPPQKGLPLTLSGSTALDPTRLQRIRARFPAEVIKIGQALDDPETSRTGQTAFREWRTGDRVGKGDELLVFWSVEVGTKKSELVDALVQLRLDKEILERSESAAGSVPAVTILTARRNVEADQNAIARAVNTLQTWGIPKEDIQAVYEEAKEISQRKGQRDRSKEEDWARVVIKSQANGVIIERNVNLHELVVDNTANLFVVAQVDRLKVLAYAHEDILPELEKLEPSQRKWTVSTVGALPQKGMFTDIGYLIDPNQHSAVVKGYIDNPGDRVRGGQFVSVAIDRPTPVGVVEVPITAILEDGKESVVLVQPDPKQSRYTMRRVQVTHRFDKTAYVRSDWTPEEEFVLDWDFWQNGQASDIELLLPGERVLTSGALELKAALEDEESKGK
ncbi:MAG: response regulator [Gemmataceae bacterium]